MIQLSGSRSKLVRFWRLIVNFLSISPLIRLPASPPRRRLPAAVLWSMAQVLAWEPAL